MNMSNAIRIVLAEDQEIVRQGLRYIINSQPDMAVVGEAANGDDAIRVTLSLAADVVLMVIRMPGQSGVEATRAILKSQPATKIILLTTFDIQEYVYDGIRAGAVGYLLKDAETRMLLDAIRAAYQGAVIYRSISSGKVLSEIIDNRKEIAPTDGQISTLPESLTERELDVLQQMAFGRRNSEIASLLSISEGTVKTHIHRILQKFQVEDRTQAVVLAIRRGIVH
jgi:DNA-binding NarL/FixJ family response regulator